MRCYSILVTCVLVLCFRPGSNAQACPAEPTDSWVYPYLYELRLREPTGWMFLSTGPYGRLETAAWLESVRLTGGDTRGARLHEMLKSEFEGEAGVLEAGSGWTADLRMEAQAETDSRTFGEALGRFAYYSPLGVCFWTSLRASVNGLDRHKVEAEVWRDRARASVDYAGVAFSKNGLSVTLRRDEVSWGAGRRTGLLFSGTAPVFDMLSIGYRTRRVAFTSFHSELRRGRDESPDDGVRRFVSAHRLEVLPSRRISLAISEAVVYGGLHRAFEPVYLNPLTIFYVDQWNSDRNDNILIAGDFSLLFPQGAEIRGEIMIDDFQYDFGTEPHEFGAGLSFTAVNPVHPRASLIGASYYHVRNQTYGHFFAWNRFVQEGQVMGYPDGPDGDRLAFWLTLASPETVIWTADYSLRRKGEGRATDAQEHTGSRVDFPSGTVETCHAVGLEAAWRPSHAWLVGAGARYRHTENAGHLRGADESGWDLSLMAQFNLNLNTWLGD